MPISPDPVIFVLMTTTYKLTSLPFVHVHGVTSLKGGGSFELDLEILKQKLIICIFFHMSGMHVNP